MASNSIGTAQAKMMARQWRFNQWVTAYLMDGISPCEACSVPEPDYVYTLGFDAEGDITDTAIDIGCTPDSLVKENKRVVYINCDTDEENTGNGVSTNVDKIVYLTHCTDTNTNTEVTVYLQNNGSAVTEDQYGNPLPESYLVGLGQVKYLMVAGGKIVGIRD